MLYFIAKSGIIQYIANKLYSRYGVAAPCRITCTVCGLLTFIKNKFICYRQ
ncbi:hypothetical protein l11_18110 [Neisseria weaveri LMG 5135]|nr:hypothetical protein l11_18110 [Neisseria weaveri LMG 5135]EGV38169.1 hypothetical protein l13_01580 [Neisseria weaveri ATCC 51223]